MEKVGDARTCVLLTSGYSLALSVGLFGTAVQLDEPMFAGYAALSGIFFLSVILGASRMLASRQRRWWFAIAALFAIAIVSFGRLAGFIFYAAPLATYLTLFMAPYGFALAGRRSATAGGAAGATARSGRGQPGTSAT